jgi:hypothetical protein
MEDDLYPRQGDYFGISVPDDQKREQETEKADVLNALPILEKVIGHLDKKIIQYSSINGVSDEVLTNPEEFMHAITANKIVVSILVSEKEALESLVKEYR